MGNLNQNRKGEQYDTARKCFRDGETGSGVDMLNDVHFDILLTVAFPDRGDKRFKVTQDVLAYLHAFRWIDYDGVRLAVTDKAITYIQNRSSVRRGDK